MKIVFDARVHLNYYSGISRYIICLLEAYLAAFPDDEIHLLLNPTIKKDNSIYQILGKHSNANFHTIDMPHMGPKNYWGMKGIIQSFNADVYHYPHLDAPVKTGTPLVCTVHDANYSRKIKKFNDPTGLKTIYFKKALGLSLKHSNKVLFVSKSVKEELSVRYGYSLDEERFEFMHNGLESDFNQIDQATITKVKKELELPENYFLYVGQIREHKNIRRIIDAFNSFSTKNDTINLVLAGHNYLQQDLNSERIIHLDEVSNQTLKVLYSQCQAVTFPSLFEGFGFPIIEGFSFGKNVITSDRGATKEVGNDHAILVDPESVSDIEAGMHKAAQQPFFSQELVDYAKQFSWKTNAYRLREIYSDLAN